MSQKGQFTTTGITEVKKLTGDVGGPVPATLGNINLLGSANIATVGDPITSTINFYIKGTTDHALQVGNLAGGISSLAVGTNGQMVFGVTGGDPVFGNLTAGNGLVATPGAGTVDVSGIQATTAQIGVVTLASDAEAIAGTDTSKVIVPTSLKAKLGTQTLHGIALGASDSVALAWTAAPTDGQLLIGKTGFDPVLATPTNGNNITWTGGAGTLKADVTGTTQYAVQVGSAANALSSLAVGAVGEVFIGGGAAANPKWLAASGVLNNILMSTAAGDPKWSTSTYPDTIAIGSLLHASAANTITALAVGGTGTVLVGNTGAAPSWTAALTDGQLLIGKTGFNPVLATPTNGNNITWTGGAGTLKADVTGTTNHAVQVGNGTNSLSSLAVGATLEILTGVTGADPAWSSTPTVTTMTATTLRTGDPAVATSIMSLSGKTVTMSGTDATVGLTITTKNSGALTMTSGNVAVSSGDVDIAAGNLKLPVSSSTVGQIQIGAVSYFHAYGYVGLNLFAGSGAGNFTFDASTNTKNVYNVGIGGRTLDALAGVNASEGYGNTACGYNALTAVTTGSFNTGLGNGTGILATTADHNIFVGYHAGYNSVTTGSYNIMIGGSTGANYASDETSNILIGYNIAGTAGEDNVLRIGTATGTGNGELNRAYIHGITSYTTVGANTRMVTIDSSTKLMGITASNSVFYKYEATTSTSVNMVAGVCYIANHSSAQTFNLPASADVGDVFGVITGSAVVAHVINANTGDYVVSTSSTTTAGGTVTFNGSKKYSTIELVCIVANSTFVIRNYNGSLIFA